MHEQFCMLRIFRLFRINAYYDSLSVITEVIVGKKQQLLSSVLSCLQQFYFPKHSVDFSGSTIFRHTITHYGSCAAFFYVSLC